MRTNRRTFPAAEIHPLSSLRPLELEDVFSRIAPMEIDLGCGDGNFLIARAIAEPMRNFIGVEKMPGRVRSTARKIGNAGLKNVRVLSAEILDAVQQLFAPNSVEVFHLLFSDPWPKRRHHHRRVVNASFLRATWRALRENGELRIATDDRAYFEAIEALVATSAFEIRADLETSTAPTTFENRFRARDQEIYRVTLRKVLPPMKDCASQRSR